jgi:hypothetical protein
LQAPCTLSLRSVCAVRRSYLPPLLLLSAIWGSSYMFIKVGVRDFSPAAMVELRLLLAGLVLVLFVAARRGARDVRPALAPGALRPSRPTMRPAPWRGQYGNGRSFASLAPCLVGFHPSQTRCRLRLGPGMGANTKPGLLLVANCASRQGGRVRARFA